MLVVGIPLRRYINNVIVVVIRAHTIPAGIGEYEYNIM